MSITESVSTKGFRGMLGGTMVFRKVGDDTVVAAAPGKTTRLPTVNQEAQRSRFRLAAYYARRVKEDPVLLGLYKTLAQARGVRYYPLVIKDYFTLPMVDQLLNGPNGELPGVKFTAVVVNEIAVRSVTLRILSPDTTLLDSGSATVGADGQSWSFVSEALGVLATGNQVEVTAVDYPGNTVTEIFTI